MVTEAGNSVAPWASTGTGFSLAARCTSRSRSICEHSPSVTGSSGVRLAEFQWVRSRIASMVDLVVPTSRMIWLSFSSGMIAHQPQNGVRAVLAARHRRIARALFRLGFGQPHLRLGDVQAVIRIGFGGGDFLAGQLSGDDRIGAFDALGGVAVGDRLHFERMQVAQLRDLVEGQRRIVDEPHGGRFRHQGLWRGLQERGISVNLPCAPPARRGEATYVIKDDWKARGI